MDSRQSMIVDVVDDRNRAVSRAERRELLPKGLNFRTVHILLFDRENQIFLQRLVAQHPRSPSRLGSSVAGYLRANETYFHAARRKLREELSIPARIRSVGQFEMNDEGSRKFVGVYVGRTLRKPTIADDLVKELVLMTEANIRKLIHRNPAAFTTTFVSVYDYFRRRSHQDRR